MAQRSLTVVHEPGPPKRSSTSGNPNMVKFSSMNKSKKRSYKKYRGQGR
jgi:hypothetical protein